ILTGRANQFDHLRQFKGMSGFPKSKESEHDAFDTGHSSTSISVAAGMAAARDIKHQNFKVVAVIGDGSMTGGLAFEALNNIGASKSNVIVVLNDNGMSISKNIGGLSQHLGKLRTSNGYLNIKKSIKNALNKFPGIGPELSQSIGHAKDRVKYALLSGGVIFEELGITYLGPVDGHNIKELIETLNISKHVSGPVLIHVITQKGKGYRNAELQPNKFHGIGPFDKTTGVPDAPSTMTFSKVLGEAIIREAKKDNSIVAVAAAMGEATGLGPFAKQFPNRYFDVGIAEGHAVTFSAGLAKEGMKPLVAIYSSFLQRGYDQIIEDVCLQNLPVVFAIDRAGNVGADGETHHGLFDLSYLSLIPNLTILSPKDGNQLSAMLSYAFSLGTPCAIRYPRGTCEYDSYGISLFHGKNVRMSDCGQVDIWAVGNMCKIALEVKDKLLQKGITAGIVDVTMVKPMDLGLLSPKAKLVVTLEDNVVFGGFGEKLKNRICNYTDILNFGWPDKFIEHGSVDELFKEYGLDSETISERICDYFEGKA
ncbi:MAG: 1-deoxy-D-xylulose-5-phosphate synthase, partial [Anaerovoracaceae bacterium]